jgi:hypothetical protein
MLKYLSLFIVSLFMAGAICAIGITNTVPGRCSSKPVKKTIRATQPARDEFKAKYWILASIFRQ